MEIPKSNQVQLRPYDTDGEITHYQSVPEALNGAYETKTCHFKLSWNDGELRVIYRYQFNFGFMRDNGVNNDTDQVLSLPRFVELYC